MSFDKDMMRALEEDGEKLRQLTGEDHGPWQLQPAGQILEPNASLPRDMESAGLRAELLRLREVLVDLLNATRVAVRPADLSQDLIEALAAGDHALLDTQARREEAIAARAEEFRQAIADAKRQMLGG